MKDDRPLMDRLTTPQPTPAEGRRTGDIALPLGKGKRDPRLDKPDVLGALGKAAEGYKSLQAKGLAGGRSPAGRR